MSVYTEEEMMYTDIQWLACDRSGNLGVFFSAGMADVPDFVYLNKERTEKLEALFDSLPVVTRAILLFDGYLHNPVPSRLAGQHSGKGFFYYDSDDGSGAKKNHSVLRRYYTLLSKPAAPLKLTALPEEMRELLRGCVLPVDDFGRTREIAVRCEYDGK